MAGVVRGSLALVLLAAAVPQALAGRGREAVTPVQKVLQMLDGMLSKGKAGKHDEEVSFAKFQEWCEGTRSEKTKSIEAGKQQITQLEADIAKASSDVEVLGGEVAGLQEAIAKAEGEVKTATALREKERADYRAQHQDLSESIDAIKRAIQVLHMRTADVPQSLAQVRALPTLPAKERAVVEAFLQASSGEPGDQQGVPEANAYEFQSGSVIELLEKLAIKFKDQRLALQKAELNAKHNFEMLNQQLSDNIKASRSSEAEKAAAKAGRAEDAAAAKGEKDITEKAKAEDEATLEDATTECHMRSEEFEKNQVTRAEEVKALEKAIEILSGAAVAGHAETHLPALLQRRAARALAQVRSVPQSDSMRRAAAYLQAHADKLGSHYLAVIAEHARDDPFGKVKKMIKDLLTRLMEEANEEADHHAYCTTELATNKQTRENKAAETDKLTAEVDELEAKEVQLAVEIQQLGDAIAEIQGQQADATRLRGEEKAANAKAVADAKEAQQAVQQAIEVLRAFYAKAENAAAAAVLLQGGARAAQHHGAPYKGMMDEQTGVLGMLDVIMSDFARLETETSTAEDQAVTGHEKFMAESTKDAAIKGTEKEHKEATRERTQELLRSTKKELELTQEELTQALDYYDKLKTDCLDTGLSYSERKKRREEEIQSLQEAMRILDNEDVA